MWPAITLFVSLVFVYTRYLYAVLLVGEEMRSKYLRIIYSINHNLYIYHDNTKFQIKIIFKYEI